jgi:hypothetical protein
VVIIAAAADSGTSLPGPVGAHSQGCNPKGESRCARYELFRFIAANGGCTGGNDEYGTWPAGASAIGNIACPINNANGLDLIWGDLNTTLLSMHHSAKGEPGNVCFARYNSGRSYDWNNRQVVVDIPEMIFRTFIPLCR